MSTASFSTLHPAVLALQRAQLRVRSLEAYLAWEDQLFANPHLSATHKLTLRATRRATERGQTKDEAGRTKVFLGTIAEQIGVSPDTVSRSLKVLAAAGAISKDTKAEMDQKTGELKSYVYAALEERVLRQPKEIAPPTPRNHGGVRYTCQQCGSQEVQIRRRIVMICKRCQHESLIEETEHDQEPADPSEPQDAALSDEAPGMATAAVREGEEQKAPDDNLRPIIKPVSPPLGSVPDAANGETDAEPQDAERSNTLIPAELHAAADLLVALAGPSEDHIQMCPRGSQKYVTIHRPLTHTDALAHLCGSRTLGAACRSPEGKTRGLVWDVDDEAGWQQMQEAARTLAAAGYLPILEPSPAGRGGHLLLLFDTLVDAEAARRHLYGLAPALTEVKEYWPGPAEARHWNRVRLPGGKYVRPGISAWCRLVSVADGETAQHSREEGARLLLSHQTQASLVPEIMQEVNPQDEAPVTEPVPQVQGREAPPTEIDSVWLAKYGNEEGRRLWFAFTPAYVAAWWNARHDLDDLLPSEQNGYGLATWRGEHEGSVAKRDGRWADFGQSARRPDGNPDTGDALELATRISGAPKPEVLRQAAKELLAEARAALEHAARIGQPLPTWLEEILTDAGRRHYARLSADRQAQESTLGGLPGFSRGAPDTDVPPQALQAPATDDASAAPPAETIALLQQHHLWHSTPCSKCGCPLSRELARERVCCRCFPTKDYSTFAAAVDRLYPRKRSVSFETPRQRLL